LSFEDDQKLICSLREENAELKKKVRRQTRSFSYFTPLYNIVIFYCYLTMTETAEIRII